MFPLTYEIADELERVGGEVLCGVNRSKAFRVMVAYFAFVHKLKESNTGRSGIAFQNSARQQASAHGMIVESLLPTLP